MGWCSLKLLLVVLMHHATLKPNPLDELTVNLNLENAPNGGHTFESHEVESEEWKTGKTTSKDSSCNEKRNQRQEQQTGENKKRILGGIRYMPGVLEGVPDYENWMASIKTTRAGASTRCGGVLISPQHILTALHCIFDKNDGKVYSFEKVKIYFDPKDLALYRGTEFRPAKYFFVEGKNKMPEYFGPTKILNDDIAVIKLEKAITEFDSTSSLRPLQISKWPGKKMLKICEYWNAGWGTYRLPKERALFLQYTKNIPYKECPEDEFQIPKNRMCFKSTSKDAICPGDSGSSGVIAVNKNSWVLQSIHTQGFNCSETDGIAMDIDVYQYREKIAEWIEQKY